MSDLAWRREPLGWLTHAVWALERAFKKARAADQAERDTRLRIFFLLALFATGFLFLAAAATRCALFAKTEVNGYVAPVGAARADLVDRNGQLLAVDLTHYGVYIDPREIWDTAGNRPRPRPDPPEPAGRAPEQGPQVRSPRISARRPDAGREGQAAGHGPAGRVVRGGGEARLSAGLHRRAHDRLLRHQRHGPLGGRAGAGRRDQGRRGGASRWPCRWTCASRPRSTTNWPRPWPSSGPSAASAWWSM
ncbi:MAG: hypothetical protein WDN45_07905 [Caulobacteraceae bacterium]